MPRRVVMFPLETDKTWRPATEIDYAIQQCGFDILNISDSHEPNDFDRLVERCDVIVDYLSVHTVELTVGLRAS